MVYKTVKISINNENNKTKKHRKKQEEPNEAQISHNGPFLLLMALEKSAQF